MPSPTLSLFRSRRGFTLFEIVAVVVVLAALAGVAIPKRVLYVERGSTSAIQNALGKVRASISRYYAESGVADDRRCPTAAELVALDALGDEGMPVNPLTNSRDVQCIASRGDADARLVRFPDRYGWNYFVDNSAQPPIAIIWANCEEPTTVKDRTGAAIPANAL